ncbi:MAG: hypothetical protein Kow00121_08820 [Elainellaceae cyanobacterium]
METLAYLHLATEYENSEVQKLNLEGLKGTAVAGMLGVACAVGVVGMADSASAHGYYGYRHAPVSYRHYPSYSYYSYNYYPRHYYAPRYYNPCYY